MPKNLSEVFVYQKALKASEAVSAVLDRPTFGRNFTLSNQLSRSSMRVAPLIAEGFGQLSDRHLAVYLGRARGSVLETLGHLEISASKGLISPAEHTQLVDSYDHIAKMLSRWIKYLQKTDYKDRW